MIFIAEKNPLNDNETIIYQKTVIDKIYRFSIDKANFQNDDAYQDFIIYCVGALNKLFEK